MMFAQQSSPTDYTLGSNDLITLSVANLNEMSGKPMRIDGAGDINLPLVGRIHAADLTASQLEKEIEARLQKQVNEPHVIVSITEFRSQPVTILGFVGAPGLHQLEGRKTLFEMLSIAGGLRIDAGYSVKITRKLKWGRIPLPSAQDDPSGEFSVASVSVNKILNGTNPTENIVIKPEDTITVPKADLIYIIGSVRRPGGYVMGQEQTISALQIISLAEGLEKTAAGQKARVMRTTPGNPTRIEIPINLNKLMAGKVPDLPLKSDDILFVPSSAAKSVLIRTGEAASSVLTQAAIYAAH